MTIYVRGVAYGERYDYKCQIISRTEDEVILSTLTDPAHEIVLRRRFPDDNLNALFMTQDIVCHFMFDAVNLTVAILQESERGMLIEPIEHWRSEGVLGG